MFHPSLPLVSCLHHIMCIMLKRSGIVLDEHTSWSIYSLQWLWTKVVFYLSVCIVWLISSKSIQRVLHFGFLLFPQEVFPPVFESQDGGQHSNVRINLRSDWNTNRRTPSSRYSLLQSRTLQSLFDHAEYGRGSLQQPRLFADWFHQTV